MSLTTEQRACLLRAARRRLTELQDERARFVQLGTEGSAVAALADEEIECLMGAVSWLWRTHAGS